MSFFTPPSPNHSDILSRCFQITETSILIRSKQQHLKSQNDPSFVVSPAEKSAVQPVFLQSFLFVCFLVSNNIASHLFNNPKYGSSNLN